MLAITVVLLHTRLPMTESDRLTVSTILGVIILFFALWDYCTYFSHAPSLWFPVAKINIKIYR